MAEPSGPPASPAHRAGIGRWLWRLGLALVLLLVVIVGALWLAAGQPATLRWLAAQAQQRLGDSLALDRVEGSLLGPVAVGTVRWRGDGVVVTAQGAKVAWQPYDLFRGRARVDQLEADRIEIDLTTPAVPPPKKEPAPIRLPERIELPVTVSVGRIAAGDIVVRRDGKELVRVAGLEAVATAVPDLVELTGLGARVLAAGNEITLGGEASMRPMAPYQIKARIQSRADLQGKPLRVDLRADGQLASLDTRINAQWADARVVARSLVQPLDPRPLRELKLDISDLDLAKIDAALPQTDIVAKLEAELFPAWSDRPDPPLLVGPIEINNSLAGPLDVKRLPVARIRTVTSLTGDRINLQGLQITGPAGQIDGQLHWSPGGFAVDARSAGLKLSALQSSLQPRTVALDAKVRSERPISERAIDFDLKAHDSEVRATALGKLRGEWLDLDKLAVELASLASGQGPNRAAAAAEATMADGRKTESTKADATKVDATKVDASKAVAGHATVAGRVRTVAPYDIDLNGAISDLQPHRLVRMPPALFNGSVKAQGTLGGSATPASAGSRPPPPGRLDLGLTLTDSQVNRLPLAGRVVAALQLQDFAPRALADVDAALRWGEASAKIRGGLGEGLPGLDLDASIPTLKPFLDDAGGAIQASARLQGQLTAPAIEVIDLKADKLSLPAGGQRLTVERFTAVARHLQLDLSAPIEVNVEGRALRLAPAGSRRRADALIDLDTLDAQVQGTPGEHRIDVRGDGRSQALRLVATGAATGGGAGNAKAGTPGSKAGEPTRAKAGGPTRAKNGSTPRTGSATTKAPVPLSALTGWSGRVEQLSLKHRELAMPTGGAKRDDVGVLSAGGPFSIRYVAAAPSPAPARAPAPGPAPGPATATAASASASAAPATVVVEGARLLLQGAHVDIERLRWADGRLEAALDGGGVPAYWATRFGAIEALYLEEARQQQALAPSRPAGVSQPKPPSDPLMLGLKATFSGLVSDTSAADWVGRAAIHREGGDLHLVMPASSEGYVAAGLERLDVSVEIANRQLKALLAIAGVTIGTVDGQFDSTLAAGPGEFWAQDKLARSSLGGRFGMSMRSLRWISPLVGETWRFDGALASNLKLGGTLAAPRVEGAVTGANLSADDQETGMRLHDGVLAAEFSGDRVDVMLLRFLSGDGSVSMDGQLRVPKAGATSQARVNIDKLPIPLGVGQRVVVSGDATAALYERTLSVNGKLIADEGVIELRSNSAPKLGDDVVIVDAKGRQIDARDRKTVVQEAPRRRRSDAATGEATPTAAAPAPATPAAGTSASKPASDPFRISTELVIDLGEHFRVFGSGVNARLAGAITLSGVLPERPTAKGVVTIVDGTYQIYGRRLDIREGEVRFNGPVDNPSLYIIAVRRYLQVEPRVEITGTASNPVVTLTSEPEVSDAEKLSWLILGTGLDEAQGAGQLLILQAAADSMFGDEDSKYADSLTDRLGIDMLSIKDESATTTASGQSQGTVVAVGKRLSNRLFVTYEQSLRGVYNIVKLQYDITQRLSLSVQAGSDSAADLLWHFPFN